jgi:hypothetical protein
VSRYVITIAPDDEIQDDAAQTTVRIDTSTGQTLITELTVRAADGGGLAPADLPPIDLDLLVRALTASAPALALPPADDGRAAAALPAGEADEVTGAEQSGRSARRGRGGRRRAATRGRGGKRVAKAAKQTGAKATRRRASRQSAGDGTRPYRRMPDADEVIAAYEQVGSITGLAEHFDVPRHTVTSWARRLRQQGYAIGRASS